MKLSPVMPLTFLLLSGCAGSGPHPDTGSAAAKTPPPASAPAATPAPAVPAHESTANEKKAEEAERLASALAGGAHRSPVSGEPEVVTNPKTGKQEQRIAKSTRGYTSRQNRLFATVVRDESGVPILHEDDQAWYVALPTKGSLGRSLSGTKSDDEKEGGTLIKPIPQEEAEVALPVRTAEKLHLEEISEGLPSAGQWRENFSLADMVGDGRLEIVAPPPRLSAQPITIFRFEGRRWSKAPAVFEDPEKLGFGFGGVATADMDGDGKIDIVYGRHGGGPALARNLGGYRFQVSSSGLPRAVTTRALAIGDLDGDGHPDILSISDEPEYLKLRAAEDPESVRAPGPDGFQKAFDARAFFYRDGKYVENHEGLGEACFGYSVGLDAAPKDGGDPFYASSCRYAGNPRTIYTFDRKTKTFALATPDVGEIYAMHYGTAMGTYRGFPAAFQTYSKATPEGGSPNISGYGISIYYREGSVFKRFRLLKELTEVTSIQGIAVGDLNGDGLDDVVMGDDGKGKLRVFFQRADGSFDELADALEPSYVNHSTSIRIGDIDGDGRNDIVLMTQPLTPDATRSGGLRVFFNRP